MTAPERHIPVMRDEVLAAIAPRDGDIIVDATFGAGGYAKALLDAAACTVWGIDRDPDAIARGADLAARYAGRLYLIEGPFADMDRLLAAHGVAPANGVVLDIGVSSDQLEDPGRGFSFTREGPLDMRMGPDGQTAADIVNSAPAETLADIIYRLGEERQSRRIARAIIAARKKTRIETTTELAAIVEAAVGRRGRARIHPATRTFQALRIYINDELGQLENGLVAAERVLAPEGRLCVVAFHSLEDRVVKRFLRQRSGKTPRGSRHHPSSANGAAGGLPSPTFRPLFKGAKRPGEGEVARNPRARSARMRAAIRTDAPAWEREATA